MPVQARSAGRSELAWADVRSTKKAEGENVKPDKTQKLKLTSDKTKGAKAEPGKPKVDKAKQNGAQSDSKTRKAKAYNPKRTKVQKNKAGKSKTDEDKPQKSMSVAEPAPRTLDFSHHYDNAYAEMYVDHERARESRKWEAALNLTFKIEISLHAIAAQTNAHSPYETKFSAIDTIRAIFALLDGVWEILKIVRQDVYSWGDYLMSVLDTFDENELDQLYVEKDSRAKDGEWWIDLFGEMVDMADDYELTDDLRTGEAWELLIGDDLDEEDVQTGEDKELQDDGEVWEGFDD